MEPEVVSALEFGQKTKNDSPLSEEEKQEITNDMEQINNRLKALKEDSSNQNEWYVETPLIRQGNRNTEV